MLPTQVVRELMLLERVQAVRCPDARALVRPLYLLQLRERPPSPSLRAFCEVLAQPPEA
jgi:DNA-binding transcriptional LysR family regulator